MKNKGMITISRGSDDKVRICIKDSASKITFVGLTLSLSSFAEAITGLAMVEGDLETKGLEFVGKKLVRESRRIQCPLRTYNTAELQNWLKENAQEDGWEIDTYLGSQGSVSWDNKTDSTVLTYSVYRYDEV